jgi:Fe-S-cluster-containing hydrogenase component 2
LYHPLKSLREGHWFKLICGASFQHLPAVRSLTLAYALAGADCIDVAADPAVLAAVHDALRVADSLAETAKGKGFRYQSRPWLMVSLTDGEDPHFRKAEFDPAVCPDDCSRPCELVCPARAIVFEQPGSGFSGVIDSRCYGCGRCVPLCPIQQISTRSYVSTPAAIAPLVLDGVDAVEIHTQVGRLDDFRRLWQAIVPFVDRLKLIAVSCPDGEGLIEYLWSLYDLISPLPCALIWQTDGRPMSGDIGDGATRATIKLSQKVLSADLPGYVQLAGGTNRYTVDKLRAIGLLNDVHTSSKFLYREINLQPSTQKDRYISGVAYGSYARVLLAPLIEQLERDAVPVALQQAIAVDSVSSPVQLNPEIDTHASTKPYQRSSYTTDLETNPDLLWQAVSLADSLVSQLKHPMKLLNFSTYD